MRTYKIALHGCDDSTYLEMNLNEEQLKLVKTLCKKSWTESSYGCMPIMEVDGIYERED